MRRLLTFVLLASLATATGAQGIYKYTDKDGRVVYTDDPQAGGGHAQPVEDQTSVVPAQPRNTRSASREFRQQADLRNAGLDRAVEDIAAATDKLRDAEARRMAGIEPVEGERQGRRYRPEYWERQAALQRDVDIALRQLDEANARRNALR